MRIKTILSVSGLAAALFSAGAASAQPVKLTQLGSISCTYYECGTGLGVRVKGSGRYLYAAGGAGLRVYDVHTPATPVLINTVPSVNAFGDVIVAGRYLYVVTAGGLQVADANDPAAPVLVGQVTFSSGGGAFSAISGQYVYAGLRVVDVSNPTAPTVVGTLSISGAGTAQGIAISETNAYVTDDAGRVHIVDVSDPAAATEIGYLDLNEPAYDIEISGAYAYVVTHGWYCDEFEGCTRTSGHLQVLDISGGSCARLVASIGRPKAPEEILISGGYAYISEWSLNFYTYAGELTVVDIRNPAAPVNVAWAGTASFSGGYTLGYQPLGVAVLGDAAFVTTPWSLITYGAFNPPAQCF